jgi:hypothetical protein
MPRRHNNIKPTIVSAIWPAVFNKIQNFYRVLQGTRKSVQIVEPQRFQGLGSVDPVVPSASDIEFEPQAYPLVELSKSPAS